MQLKVVCAWCGKTMGIREIPDEDMPPLPITHSICSTCKAALDEENERILQNHKITQSQERR
jgi:hypothetical protein